MAKPKQCCKTCKFWDADKARSESGRIISNRVASCLYPVEEIKLPESHPAFHETRKGVELRWMAAGYGTNCPVWERVMKP